MKSGSIYKICISVILLFLSALSFGQDIRPISDKALIQFTVTDLSGNPIDINIFFLGKESNNEFSTKSNGSKGNEILLPIEETYTIYSTVSTDSYEIPLTKAPNQFYKLALQFDNSKANQLHPTPNKTLVKILLFNHKKEPQQEQIVLISQITGKRFQGKSDAEGILEILIPNNDTFRIDIGSTQNYSKLSLPKIAFYKFDKLIQYEGKEFGELQPSKDFALFNLIYLDLDEKPVKGEVFTVKSMTTGKIYKTTPTNNEGLGQIKVPIGDQYSISAKYFRDFVVQEVSDKPDLYFLGIKLKYISSKKFEKRERERERMIAARDSLYKVEYKKRKEKRRIQDSIRLEEYEKWKAYQDSIVKVQMVEQSIEDSIWQAEQARIQAYIDSIELVEQKRALFFDSLRKAGWTDSSIERYREKEDIKEEIFEEKRTVEIELIKNPKYFEEIGYEVCAVFYRMKRLWKSKIVVADLTCSMYPYSEQLLLWTVLEINKKEDKHFHFFNDGDGMPNNMKAIGKTGGIHTIKSNNLDSIIITMLQTMETGCSGDKPENDLEATLEGQKSMTKFDELILIADNYSNVRDISLLKELNVPVRIILCGVHEKNPIHEQYLDIAYHTGGSVHTIEGDIMDIVKTMDGKIIKIGKIQYMLTNGRFVRLTKI